MIKANLLVDSCDANGTLLNWLWMHRCADWSRLAIIPSDRSRKPMWVLFSYKNMTLSLPGSQRRVVKMLCSNWDLAGITWSSYAYGYKSINSQSATSCNVIRWNSKKKKIQHIKLSLWSRVCGYRCSARISWILFNMKMAEWSLWISLSIFLSKVEVYCWAAAVSTARQAGFGDCRWKDTLFQRHFNDISTHTGLSLNLSGVSCVSLWS